MSIPTTTWIIIGVSFGFSFLIFLIVWKRVSPLLKSAKGMIDGMSASNQLLATGISADAKVLNVRPTNTMVNNMPVIEVTLEIQPKFGNVYQVIIKSVIHQIHIPRVQPMANVPVKIDPNNPNNVVLNL